MANKLNIYNSSAIYDSMVKDGFLKADKLSKEKFLTALEYNPKYMPRVRSYVQRVYGMSPEDFDNLVYTPDYSQDVSDLPPSGSSDYVPSMPWDNTPAQFSLPYKTKPGSDNNLPGLPAHDNTSQPNFMRDLSPENVTRRALANAKPQPMQYLPKEEWDKEIRKKEAIQQGLQEIAAHSTRSTTDYSQPISVKSVTHPSDLSVGEWYNAFASDTYSIQKEAGRIYQMWQVGAIDEDEARSRFHQLYVSPQTAQSRSFVRTIDERRNFRRNNAAIDAAEAEITKKLQAAAAQKPTQPIPMPYMGDARISDSIDEQYYKQSLRFLDDARKISRAYADNNYNGTSTAQRVLRGIGDNLITPEAITMGFSAIADNANLIRILEKDERGEQLSDAEETLLSAAIIKQYTEAAYASGTGIAYNIGAVTGESLPYMLSFVVTGIPIKAATSGISKRIVNFVGRQLQRKGIGRIATRATKTTLGLGGNIATSALQAPIMPSTYSDYLDRRIGTIDSTTDGMGNISFSHQGDNRSTAALKAYFNTLYQNFGERSGEAISSLWGMFGRGIGKIPIGRGKSINDIFNTIHDSRLGKFWDVMQGTAVADFMRQANYDGVFAEVVEEYISGILNAATIGDQSFEELFSQDNLLTTMGGIALTSVMLGSANATLGVAATQRIRTNFNRSSKAAQQYFSPEQLNQLIAVSGGSVQDITTFLAANIARRQLIARQISQLAARQRNGETGIEAQINTLGAELQDLRMQYDFVNASAMYNAYIGGLSRRIEPMREQARAAIRANGDPATGLTIQVNVNGRQGYLIGGNYNHIQDADGNISVTPTGDLATVLFDGDKTPTPNIPMETISILGVRRTDDVIRDGDRAIFAATEQEENAAQAPATGSTVTVSGSQGNFILQGYDPQGNAIVTPLNTDGTPAVKNGNPITASVPSENIIPEEADNTSSSIRTGSIAYIDGIPYSVDQVDGENAIIHQLNNDGTPVNDEQGNPVTSIVPTATLSSSPHPTQTVEPQNVPDEQQPTTEQQATEQDAAIEETNTQQQPAIVDDNITETPSSALSRIPIDKNGKPIYEQSDPETAYDAILQQADGDTALASRVILSMIDNKEAALKKLSKAKPRRADNPADIINAEKELATQIKQAESDLQFWKDTALVPSLRNQAQKEAEANSVIQDPSLANTPDSRTRDNDGSGNHQGIGAIQADVASTQENSEERLTHEEALAIISDMEKHAEVAPEIELTPENWVKEFGNDGIVNTPIGEVKQGDNQYLKLAQQGRNSKLGMVRPTLERPSIIILDERPAREGKSDRDTSFVFIKTFIKEDGTRYYYFTSVTVSKEGKEVVISSQERSANRISKLLQQGKIAWIDTAFSLHPTTQVEGSVPLNDSNTPTVTDNQPALLGINSSELSQNKDNEKSPISSDLGEKIAAAEAETDTNPTEAQKEAGNYRKGHVQIGQFNVSIENPKGSVRSGVDVTGREWTHTMQNTYGYIRGTEGVDGDHIDVFLANDIDGWNGSRVFVIDQYNEDGTFDEHKVMIGFNDEADAYAAYLANYKIGWADRRKIVCSSVNMEDFEKWIDSSHRKTKPFAEYKGVNGEQKSVIPADRIKEINARLSELKERAAEARRSNDIISEARIITESNNLNAELRSLEAETKQRSISKRNLERSKLPLTEKEYANKRSEEIRKSNPDIDEIDAYNQAIDEYPSYILDKIRNGELEKIYEQASINDRIKLGRMVESAGYSVSDISSLANKKRQDEKNQNVHNIGERVTIRFYDGTIIKGDIISTGNGSVTVLNEEDKRKYTVPESRILSHQTNKEEIPNSNTPTKQARNLPGMLKEAYRQGNASDIAKSEADLRAHIESQSDLKAVAVTYFRSEDNMRQYKDKNSPEYRMNKFIADACKNALLKAGIAKEALMGERKRVAFASTTDDARTLDVMYIDPSYDVLRAVIRNPHTSDSVLRDFTERFQNNGLDYEAQQVLDERRNKKENSVRDNTADADATVTNKQDNNAASKQTKEKGEDPKEHIPKAEKIEDVGEKIGGARKDIIHELTEKARKADSDKSSILDSIRSMPVSKIFNFDYERLRKDGVSNELITLLQVIREIIPSKPRSEYKLRRWTEQVFELYYASLKLITLHDAEQRAFFDKILGIQQIDKIYQARMALGGFDSGLNTGKATLEELGENAGRYDKEGNWVSLKGHWYVKNAGKNGGIFPSRKEAEDALRTFAGENASPENSEKKTQFSVYRRNVDGTAFITVKGKPSIIVADGFKNSKEALDYLKTNYADLDAKYRSMKEKTNIAFRENRPRKGRDWRNGKNISAEEFRETFGFRGVEFGNWTNQEDRQQALNNAFDAFMDLADAIGKSPRSLSLNGQLGIAFGARGGGRAAAHYEPDKVVINLTKTQGAGSLAHEWWHAIDNYFARRRGQQHVYNSDRTGYKYNTEKKGAYSENERQELTDAFKELMNAINNSSYGKRSKTYASMKSSYWSRPTELGARAFAIWIERKLSERGTINDFLANNPTSTDWENPDMVTKYYPYPIEGDFDTLDTAFDNLFNAIQEEVDATTGNTILFRELPDQSTTQEQTNDRFNNELSRQIDGTLPKGHIYDLGMPSDTLLNAGLPNLPIEMAASRLSDKSMQENHPFDLSEIRNLPKAIQSPMAIFRSATRLGSFVVMTEIEHHGRNFVVAIQANRRKGRIEVNSIRSVHYRTSNSHIANWVTEGLLEYADKKRMVEWLSKQRYNSADVRKLFNHATNIIQNFDNPKNNNENIRLREMAAEVADAARPAQVTRQIERLAREMNLPIEIIHSIDDIPDEYTRRYIQGEIDGQPHTIAGYYDRTTGKAYIILPAILQTADPLAEAERTILHEVIAHHGMQALMGRDAYDTLCDEVWQSLPYETRARFAAYVLRKNPRDLTITDIARVAASPALRRAAADEYIAALAEGGVENPTLWQRIKAFFRSILRRIHLYSINPTDADIRYLLSQARENLAQTSTESAKAILQESNDIRFKYTNVDGINMSENAKKALEDGKTDVGKELELAYFIKESGLGTWNGEYHHVGKNYNRHYFVKLNDGVTLPAARKAFKKYLEDKRKAEIKAVLDKYPDAMTRQQVIDAGGRVFPAENRTHKDIAYAGGEYWYIPITIQEQTNDRFNDELQQQIDGTLPEGHIYQLGRPGEILLSTGIPNLPIEMSSTRLAQKAAQRNHEFGLSDVRDLPKAIQSPIAVFAYGDKNKTQNVIVEIERDGKKFVVGIHFNQSRHGVEVNDIRGIFPKNNAEWLNWISQGKLLYADKQKIQALIDKQRTILAEVEYLDLDSVTKIIQNFDNPKLSDPDIRFRELSAPEETMDNASRQGNDYARDARTHAAASIDTHSPDLSPVEQAEAVRFRELLTRDFSAASDFLNSANLINAAMQANDGKAAWLNNIQEAVFDSMLRLRLLLDRMKKDGASIPAGFNPYLAENQSRSRAQNRIAAFNEDYRRPLIESLAQCINKLREENIGVAIKDNNAAHEALSLYAQARAAVERQEVKEREAREQAKADGTEYKHREWAGLPGIQYAIIALYKGEITDDVEANKNNLQWLQDFAEENNIPTVEQYITMVEDALKKENIDNLWENIRRISEFQLTTSRDAGILSRGSYQLLTYGYNIDNIIETLYKEQRKKITDDINNGIGDKDSLAADLADLDRRHLEAVATATDLDAPDAITTLVAGGWITQDIANDIHRYYNYYLPLKGHAEITGEDLFDYNTPSMPRNASRIKSVRGHEQLARDPFNQILRDAEGCIVQAERNRWKQQLYHVLSTNRSLANGQYAIQRKYYQVIKLDDGTVRYEPYQRVVTTENNEDIITFVPTAEEIAAGTAVLLNSSAEFDIYVSQKQRSEHETIVYIDGSPISILFYDARIAKAVNGTNEAYPPQWMPRAIIQASRTIPALLTSWNPEFVLLSNPIRDTQEAIANAAIDKGFKYAALLARNLATVDRDLWAYTGGKLKQKKDNGQPLSQYEKYVVEFFENGGSVNVTQLSDYETTTKDLKKELKRALKGGKKPSKNFWKRLTEQTELRSRIATYITSRQTGSTIQDAINDAKEITVNFDRRGAQFRNFNLLQMFFNAQMQSVRRQTELMRRHPVRYATTVAILASSKVLIGLGISLLLGGGDDDNTTAEDIIRRYFEINKQLRTRNHIFIIDGEVYRIPVAPAFIPFTTLCEEAAQLAFDPSSHHRNTASQALLSVTSSVLETYVPTLISDPANIMININNEQAWRQSFASGIPMSGRALWQPFIEAIYNYDYTGNPIYTEPQFGAQHLPFHRDYRERTGKAYVYTSKLLSDLTGGNNIIPGKINIHPEQIEHVVQGLAGGIGTLAGRFTGIYKRVQGESAESAGLEFLYDIPFAARLYGGNMQQRENRYYQSLFFDDKQALEAFRAQQRYIESSKDMQDFNKEYNRETRKYFYDFATADKLATKVRKWRDAHQKGSPEYKQYEAILQDIYRTTDDAFNRLQQSNDNEPYEIIDNPYYIYNNIESQLDKELYNVNGTFMTIDDAARAWAARTRRDKKQYYTLSGDLRQIAKIRDEVKEIKKLFKEIGSDYYPGMPLNGRQQYIYRKIEQKTKALSSLYDEIALDNIQLIE